MARYKRVAPPAYAAETVNIEDCPIPGPVAEMPSELDAPIELDAADLIASAEPEAPLVPAHWPLGAVLNVRNTGADYTVTLFPEEYDPRHPERAIKFPNPARCQDFVSRWYSKQHHDPRAW